jgi:hypothetical protein
MVGNALLRSGVQINFWQSKSRRWEKFASGADRSRRHLDFWLRKKCTLEYQSLVKLNG